MPKMIVSIDGVVIKEVQLTKDRTTLGRRPYNDIVIDNLAVSGEHAVLQMSGNEVYLEDLNSTNGTYINGKVLSGAAAGRQVPLVKVVTTIGKPGVAVAAITKRPHGFVVRMWRAVTSPRSTARRSVRSRSH
jgi:pSer/pThr/pTyr-binding forkhead associated (FHA) protein